MQVRILPSRPLWTEQPPWVSGSVCKKAPARGCRARTVGVTPWVTRAASVTLVLAAAGRREHGRWAYGSNNQSSNRSAGFRLALANACVILDYLGVDGLREIAVNAASAALT